MAESEFTPTAAEIKEEESGADDPALVKLDKAVPRSSTTRTTATTTSPARTT